MILGCHPEGDDKGTEISVAEWTFQVDPRETENAQGGVLLICCDRRQGGLHSPKEGALARVCVNDHEVDVIGLREIPPGHTDYFHRVTHQEIPSVPPLIKNCGTVYSFAIPAEFLEKSREVRVRLTIDTEVRWDIDHVVLVVKRTKRKLRSWVIATVFSILGAVGTLLLNEVWKHLTTGQP
jgi:hypothetical protein